MVETDTQKREEILIRGYELYPYTRINQEVIKQLSALPCCPDFIVGLALKSYCNAKLEFVKYKKISIGTQQELDARDMITDQQIEVMVQKAIATYKKILSNSLAVKNEVFSLKRFFKNRLIAIMDNIFSALVIVFLLWFVPPLLRFMLYLFDK